MTVGIPIGFGMFAFTFALVALYVHRSNTVYDRLIAGIRQENCNEAPAEHGLRAGRGRSGPAATRSGGE